MGSLSLDRDLMIAENDPYSKRGTQLTQISLFSLCSGTAWLAIRDRSCLCFLESMGECRRANVRGLNSEFLLFLLQPLFDTRSS